MSSRNDELFWEYFSDWIDTYKVGAIREVTLSKYKLSLKHLKRIAPNLKLVQVDRKEYQQIINKYAETHEKQTVFDFNNHIKAAVMDAVDEGKIKVNPCRKVIIKGKEPKRKKIKFLSVEEFKKLMQRLEIGDEINMDTFFYLVAKTGLRFAEALGITPDDFDFEKKLLSVSKTFNYRYAYTENGIGEFAPTKNKSSVRKVSLDDKTCELFQGLIKGKANDKPIFFEPGKRVFNSTYGHRLEALCKSAGVPLINIHGLRHTHASVLFYNGISVLSVSKRLGHHDVSTTQDTYLHIIKELENKDAEKIADCMGEV